MTNSLTVRQMLQLLDSGKVSAVELCRDTLEAIHARQDLNAFITVNDNEAAAQAKAADEARASGRAGALCGVPIALKDILLTKGCPTTAASKMLANFIPPFDGTVVARLREAGAVFVGKNNCDAFAMGSSNENSAFGPVHNPRVPGCIPGGSSGGSAAAVAADLCGAAIGTDTGGSIRQPAAMCGIVGLKPTYGRVSRYGVVAFASSLDQVGPMGKSVWDVAKLLSLIGGHDERDSTSSAAPMDDYVAAAQRGVDALKGLKIGVPKEYFVGGLEPAVEQAVRATLQKMERAGAHLVEISLPHTEYAIATFYIICTAEACSNLARYDGMRFGHRSEGADLEETYRKSRSEGFGAENQRRIMLGTYVLSAGYYEAYYLHAQKVRTLIRQDFAKAFEQVDVIATPTSPTTAFPLGSRVDDPLAMYLADVFNVPCNLAGLPGISVPCGEDGQKKPIGLQLLGKWFDEATLLATAGAVEVLLGGEEAR